MFDAFLNHPAVKRARDAGEERLGKAVAHLLASDRIMGRLQSLVASALQARGTLENGVRRTFQAVNLPSTSDVEELRRRLGELEAMVDGLAARLDRSPSQDQKP
jgi:hypothetical protein